MSFEILLPAFATLFVVIDPIGLAPMFVALTQGIPAAKRRAIAFRACAIATVLLTLFALFGSDLLAAIGISMPAFRIAGGALLFLTALDMLFERRQERRESRETEDDHPDPSAFPLAIPLISGPGAIATMILLTGEGEQWDGFALAMVVMLAVMALTLLFFLAAGLLDRLLSKTGITVLTRVLGMLLAALAIQFILDGLASFGFGPG